MTNQSSILPKPWSSQDEAQRRGLCAEFSITSDATFSTSEVECTKLDTLLLDVEKWRGYRIHNTTISAIGRPVLFVVRLWRKDDKDSGLWLEGILPVCGHDGQSFEVINPRFSIRGIASRNQRDDVMKLYTGRRLLIFVAETRGTGKRHESKHERQENDLEKRILTILSSDPDAEITHQLHGLSRSTANRRCHAAGFKSLKAYVDHLRKRLTK